jgi:hypothetical protein
MTSVVDVGELVDDDSLEVEHMERRGSQFRPVALYAFSLEHPWIRMFTFSFGSDLGLGPLAFRGALWWQVISLQSIYLHWLR